MVPDKFNMVDMGGIDIIMMQGEEVPGLYDLLVESIAQCRYQCLYNWLFDGVVIPPSYVKMEVNEDEEVVINEGVTVSSDDVIHIYSVDPPTPEPEIIPLLVEENGVYNVPSGKDGFNPVTVDVPSGGGDIVIPPLPSGYKEVEYLTTGPTENYPYITFPGFNTYDYVYMELDGDGVVGGNEQAFNMNVGCSTKAFVTYGNYVVLWKSWDLITQDPGKSTFGLRFNSNYANVNYGLWRAISYTYTGKLYRLLAINPYSYNVSGATPESIKTIQSARLALIPCYRIADDVNGFYDTVGNVFYTAQRGTFGRGPEV